MKHTLPALPYDPAALEPHIDGRTMTLHHDTHHAAYVDNLNTALAPFPDLQDRTASWLLRNRGKVPEVARHAVHNNAGGHFNHSMFWLAMSPNGGGQPSGELADAINNDFGSFAQFKRRFVEAGTRLFGSGWVWLVSVPQEGGKLQIETSTGHDNPLTQGHFPLLVNDVWEHAYYLKHHNRRPEYLNGWWAITDWVEVARQFGISRASSDSRHAAAAAVCL